MANDNTSGKIQAQGEIIPDNASSLQPVTDVKYVKGAPQLFDTIDELIAFHPNLMKRGMHATVSNPDPLIVLKSTTYILMADPATMFDEETQVSNVTEDNFSDFWTPKDEVFSNFERVIEYAPDGALGARPTFPYTVPTEGNWTPVFDASLGHKWARFRDDDVDDNADGIFDNWTEPTPIGGIGNDFIGNAYARRDINATVASNQGELVATNLPSDDSGHWLVLTGDIDIDDGTNLTVGRYFKYDAAKTYTFNTATAVQTLPPPPQNIGGASNDTGLYTAASGIDTILYTDDIPAGTDQLWEIVGQKSVYGSLKSDWVIRKINESPSLTRYSTGYTALPETVCSTTQDAGVPPFDANLDAIGWFGEFLDGSKYLATRDDLGGGTFSDWLVQQIAGENGEFKDSVFKLFPINTDFSSETPPAGADAIAEGWSDNVLPETDTEINGISQAIKFGDGTLKTPWSQPVKYTGQDTITDFILSDFGASFKYDVNSATPTVPVPTDITLEAQLYKGLVALWPNETITYVWTRIFDDGAVDATVADADTGKTFYYLGASGTPGDPAYKRSAQRLFVTNLGVNGKAVFECVQTLTLADASTIESTEKFIITDLTDGKDAKDLSVTADSQLVLYDVSGVAWTPTEVRLSAFENNLPAGTLFWYEETAPSTWTKLVDSVGGYTFGATNYGGQMQIDTSAVFTADGSTEEKRYAVSNIDGDPDINDNITTFTDYITVSKVDSSATAVSGENATFGILDNENHSVLIDDTTAAPFAGEIGSSGKALSLINVYEGATKATQGAADGQYTVSLATSNANIVVAQQVVGNDIQIYIVSWVAGERDTKITATITYNPATGPDIIFDKIFSVNSTLDAPGAILVDIESADGRFQFSPDNLTDIDLTANLYNDKLSPTLQDPADFYYSWKVGSGAFETVKAGGGGTLGEQRTVTRDEVRVNSLVEVRVFTVASPTIPTDILRSNSITLIDILDGKTYHLYQTDSEPFSEPTPPLATVDPAVGDGSWLPTADPEIWAIDGNVRPFADWGAPGTPEYDWGPVYQIGGETGADGVQGGGYFNMYSVYDNGDVKPTFVVANTDSIDTLIGGAGQSAWLPKLPDVDKIWVIQRLYKGFTATADAVELDVTGKLVGTDASAAEPVTNSVWTEPILMSGINGINGLNGTTPVKGVDYFDGETGLAPAHQWDGTQLRFFNPNGTPGAYVDLEGPAGPALVPQVNSSTTQVANYVNSSGRTRAVIAHCGVSIQSNAASDEETFVRLEKSTNNETSWILVDNAIVQTTNNDTGGHVKLTDLATVANGAQIMYRMVIVENKGNSNQNNKSIQMMIN